MPNPTDPRRIRINNLNKQIDDLADVENQAIVHSSTAEDRRLRLRRLRRRSGPQLHHLEGLVTLYQESGPGGDLQFPARYNSDEWVARLSDVVRTISHLGVCTEVLNANALMRLLQACEHGLHRVVKGILSSRLVPMDDGVSDCNPSKEVW